MGTRKTIADLLLQEINDIRKDFKSAKKEIDDMHFILKEIGEGLKDNKRQLNPQVLIVLRKLKHLIGGEADGPEVGHGQDF